MIKPVPAIILAAAIVCPAMPADAAPQKAKTQAAPQSREALYQQCRQEAFRKFGWHNGGQTVLYTDFLVEQTDLCVRNGGHF